MRRCLIAIGLFLAGGAVTAVHLSHGLAPTVAPLTPVEDEAVALLGDVARHRRDAGFASFEALAVEQPVTGRLGTGPSGRNADGGSERRRCEHGPAIRTLVARHSSL